MKRISFKDSQGLNLTQMVLTGRKIMTRRNTRMYEVGDVVAIQQSYKDAGVRNLPMRDEQTGYHYDIPCIETEGWNNKMFVRADLMPHHIRITDVDWEWLQDISDEDCMKEGITWAVPSDKRYQYPDYKKETMVSFKTPREAFASLIDKVSGRGTWERNPIVWVYEFELVD